MTQQELILDILGYAGVYGFQLEGTNNNLAEDEADVVRAIAAANQALEIIYRKGPIQLKYENRSSYFNAPTPLNNLSLTLGSKVATITAGTQPYADWMVGCSVQIDGDSVLNRITDAQWVAPVPPAVTGTATLTFLRAYTGTTDTHNATVYGDSVLLDSDVAAVLEPVEIAPNIRLRPAKDRSDFLSARYWSQRYWPRYWTQYVSFYTIWEKVFGRPQTFRVEEKAQGKLFLGINPIDAQANNVTYDVLLRTQLFVRGSAYMNEGGGDDPGAAITQVPSDMVELFLLPIARWKFVEAHPAIKNRETRISLKTAHDDAILLLSHGQTLAVQVNPTRARYI